jgi:hypothetical protein
MLKDQVERKVDSWAIRWYASVFLEGKPGHTLVENIGYSFGTHFNGTAVMPKDEIGIAVPCSKRAQIIAADEVLKQYMRNIIRVCWRMQSKMTVKKDF